MWWCLSTVGEQMRHFLIAHCIRQFVEPGGMQKQVRNFWYTMDKMLWYGNIRNKPSYDEEKKGWNVYIQCCNARKPIGCKFSMKLFYSSTEFDKDHIRFFDIKNWSLQKEKGNYSHTKISTEDHIHTLDLRAQNMSKVKFSESFHLCGSYHVFCILFSGFMI